MTLKDALARGPVARVTIAEVRGSAPREVGAAMWVWEGGQEGTIGGGTLEYEATQAALNFVGRGSPRPPAKATKHALGPDLGQCCGGAVTLVTEILTEIPRGLRAIALSDRAPTLAVERAKQQLRNGTAPARILLVDGWMVEMPETPSQEIWIWGAGHVGRALTAVLAPFPEFSLTWIDTAPDRFPAIPDGVTQISAARPELLMAHAPKSAHHLILTYSHDLDLALCDAALRRGFASCGLIGSATKWARFRKRLSAAGHGVAEISRIACPIGDPALGKHPQAIAVSVAHGLLSSDVRQGELRDDRSSHA